MPQGQTFLTVHNELYSGIFILKKDNENIDLSGEEGEGKGGSIIKNEPTVSHNVTHDDVHPLVPRLIMGKRRREIDDGKFEVRTT